MASKQELTPEEVFNRFAQVRRSDLLIDAFKNNTNPDTFRTYERVEGEDIVGDLIKPPGYKGFMHLKRVHEYLGLYICEGTLNDYSVRYESLLNAPQLAYFVIGKLGYLSTPTYLNT